MSIAWVVAYRTGGDYTVKDVELLRNNIKNFYPDMHFVVYSDDPETEKYCDEWQPLIASWSSGWWSILECFRYKDMPVMFSGLDTILVGEIDKLIEKIKTLTEKQFMMMTPFNENYRKRGWYSSGVQAWNGDFGYLFDDINKNPDKYLKAMKMEEQYTFQLLQRHKISILCADHYADVSSYKHHYVKDAKKKEDMRIICFHGYPRPSQITDPYLQMFRLPMGE